MGTNEVGIALIGAGFMGGAHARIYHQLNGARLVAIIDRQEAKAAEIARQYGGEVYATLESALKNVDFNVLDICLPPLLHESAALAAAEKGKQIICEKPIALNAASFQNIIEAVERNAVHLYVGQVVRFWPEYVLASRLYQEGALGRLNWAYACRLSEPAAWSAWYAKTAQSGGCLFDLHLHDVDYLCHLLGRVTEVEAQGNRGQDGGFSAVSSQLRFANGVYATVEGVANMPAAYPFTMRLRLSGETAAYEYRFQGGANLDNVPGASRAAFLVRDGQALLQKYEHFDAYERELADFVDCIRRDADSTVVPLSSVKSVFATMLALQKSLDAKQAVEVNWDYFA